MATLNRTQTILRNIVCNWLGYVVQAAVVFFLTPFVLRELGDARYGVWALISSVTGTYGLLAFGMQGGVNQYLTRYLARRDFQKMNEVASTATAVLSLVGLAILLISLVVAALFPYIFEVPGDLTREVRLCTVIVGASVAVQMSLFVFSSVFMASQRYDLANVIGVGTRLLSAGFTLAALRLDYGLVGISLATILSNSIDYLIRCKIAYRIVPELEVRTAFISKSAFRELFHFGAWSFLITIAMTVFSYSDSIIIGIFLPVSLLAPYSLAAGLLRQLESLLKPVEQVFYPALTHLHAAEEADTLRSVYLRGSRLFLLMVAIASVLAACWAHDFFRLWVGERFVSGQEFPSVAELFLILLCAMCCRFFPGIGIQVLQATLHIKTLALVLCLEALVNAIISIVLIQYYGLIGVSLGTLISVVLIRSFTIPLSLKQQLGVGLLSYIKHVALRPMLVAVLLYGTSLFIRQPENAQNFTNLFAQGMAAMLCAIPLAIFIGMTSADREQLIYRPAGSIKKRLVTT